jgi:hypothetical protein
LSDPLVSERAKSDETRIGERKKKKQDHADALTLGDDMDLFMFGGVGWMVHGAEWFSAKMVQCKNGAVQIEQCK